MQDDQYHRGLATRREVMGDAFVDRALGNATDFTKPLQDFVNEHAWGGVWTRDGLDRKTRSLITLSALTALKWAGAAYLLYLAIWCGIVLAVSALASANSTSFSGLMAVWILMCLILPRIAGNTAGVALASQGKLETDFAVLQSIRDTGDGHNANDPAFKALKDNLLAQYNVATVEELPVNFRGVVSRYSEAHHTEVLNKFAEQKMQSEQAQADIARHFGWLSPAIAIQTASMKLAGTDLENYQRFLRQAETIRYDFVQSMNTLHAEGLSYAQDANRYSSQQAKQEATVSSANWQILDDFHFTPLAPTQLFANSLMALLQLFCAMAVVVGFILFAGRRI